MRRAALYGGLFIAATMIAASGEAAAMETMPRSPSHHHHHHHHHYHHHRHHARHHVHPVKPHRALKHRARPHANAAVGSPPAAGSPGPAASDPAKPTTGAIGSGGGGGGGGGSGGGSWSDRRLKRDIRRIGTSPSGLGIYAFRYIWGGPVFVGVMAQDLLKSRPEAVIETESGFLMVDYDRIDVRMTTLDDYLAALAV